MVPVVPTSVPNVPKVVPNVPKAGAAPCWKRTQTANPKQDEIEKTAILGILGTPYLAIVALGVIPGVKLADEAVEPFLVISGHAAGIVSEPSIVFGLNGINIKTGKITPNHADSLLG